MLKMVKPIVFALALVSTVAAAYAASCEETTSSGNTIIVRGTSCGVVAGHCSYSD